MAANDVLDLDDLTKYFVLLKNAYFVESEERTHLESLVSNYIEEIRISRECENSERTRATSCQQYVAHEQEIVRQLITVRGENAKLKESIATLEENETFLKQELEAQQQKHEQEVMKIREQHTVELVCLNAKHDVEIKEKQATGDKREAEWNKSHAELLSNTDALQKKLDVGAETANIAASLFEEKISNLETNNENLRQELSRMHENAALMRDRANANISMWKKKSLEQERLYRLQCPVPEFRPPPPEPRTHPSILKRAKSVKFDRNAILSSPNDLPRNNAGSSGVCMPAPPTWGAPQHLSDASAPTPFNSSIAKQTPKKRRLFSNNSAMDEELYER